MDMKEGQSFVGKVAEFRKGKGWFFGAFVDEPLLNSDLVEVAWQQIPDLSPSPDQAHFHSRTVEINILLKGWMHLKIDGTEHRLGAGEFYVIWPGSVVSEITTGPDTELIVVRAPSVPDDKTLLSSAT